jgi:hypothetical protein
MDLWSMLGCGEARPAATPAFVQAIEDVRGVRIVRLRGPVGATVGAEYEAADKAEDRDGAFGRPLLLDFKATTAWDTATVAFMVQALRRRVAGHVPVGVINAPAPLIGELEIAKLTSLFRVFRTEDEAVGALAGDRTR